MDGGARDNPSGLVWKNADGTALSDLTALEKECFSVPWSEQSFAFTMRHPDLFFLPVVYDGDVLAGYAVLFCLFENAELQNIAVRENCRRRGLGEKLLIECIKEAKARGAEKLMLEVRKGNLAAVHLYEKAGFRAAGVRKNYYSQPLEDALLMVKHLSDG